MEKFIQKSKIIAGLGLDSNFSEIFEDHSKNEEVRSSQKEWMFWRDMQLGSLI
jgi:hypothetical protein